MKFVKSNLSLGGKVWYLCVGVEIPLDSVGRVRWIHPSHWGTPCGRKGRTMLYIDGALTATRPLCWSRDHQVHSENKLVELQSVWKWRCCTWASTRGTEFPARAEFPPWTPESPSPPSQDQLIHQHDEAEPDAHDQDSQWQSRRGQELRLLSSGFQLLFYEAYTRQLKKCASAEDAVCALIPLRGQGQVKIFHPLVGQYYANTSKVESLAVLGAVKVRSYWDVGIHKGGVWYWVMYFSFPSLCTH